MNDWECKVINILNANSFALIRMEKITFFVSHNLCWWNFVHLDRNEINNIDWISQTKNRGILCDFRYQGLGSCIFIGAKKMRRTRSANTNNNFTAWCVSGQVHDNDNEFKNVFGYPTLINTECLPSSNYNSKWLNRQTLVNSLVVRANFVGYPNNVFFFIYRACDFMLSMQIIIYYNLMNDAK